MEHLDEERMVMHCLDGVRLDEDERAHLSYCAQCQNDVAALTLLRAEFFMARQSQLSPDLETRLTAILRKANREAQLPSPLHQVLGTVTDWINGLVLWDSRQQGSALGVRNAMNTSYRLLYGAEDVEVELMVEPQNGLLRVVGEVMMPVVEGQQGLALIELMAHADAKRALEVESDVQGRFALEHVPPGTYVMTVTPRYSNIIVIEPLELT